MRANLMPSRRGFLKGLAAMAALGLTGGPARRGLSADKKPKFLITLAGFGGASIIDSFLAIRQSECPSFQTVNCFPDAEVKDIAGSPLRAVDTSGAAIGAIPVGFASQQSAFVQKHKGDMLALTLTGTSVNHTVAQRRAITGNGAFHGRTLAECVALEYGKGFLLPNVNMATGGYAERGDDTSLPASCYAEPVAQPFLWPLGLDGARGIKDAPDRELFEMARALRDSELEPNSAFALTFQLSEKLKRWKAERGAVAGLEADDLITKLNIVPDTANTPFKEFGLGTSPDAPALLYPGAFPEYPDGVFPDFFADPLEAQAALAFLLLKYRVSTAVTIAPSFNLVLTGKGLKTPPLAFDFSHQDHRAAQAVMWQRVLDMCDRLITLLKKEELDPTTGESFWDRTLIYVATDFGRSKNREGASTKFGSGHHLNNGVLLLSPMVNGNQVLGGVDKGTGLTYGFDPMTGAPDPSRNMTEGEIFSGMLQILDIDTTGANLPAMPVMRKA